MNFPGPVPKMLLEKSEEITPKRMMRQSQGENSTKLWMYLVVTFKSNAVKNSTAEEPGMLDP